MLLNLNHNITTSCRRCHSTIINWCHNKNVTRSVSNSNNNQIQYCIVFNLSLFFCCFWYKFMKFIFYFNNHYLMNDVLRIIICMNCFLISNLHRIYCKSILILLLNISHRHFLYFLTLFLFVIFIYYIMKILFCFYDQFKREKFLIKSSNKFEGHQFNLLFIYLFLPFRQDFSIIKL